ncbi:hypothetical protein DFQ28_004486 [Apophysomyces sp. BC1034]|nr:hypothetical protein DFQ30_004232 [Apophysomyces sp. BC1015]KAG0188701.1 hypothetical protein DFQ28_004486 [Apophysomyces sp. BC1034]
MDSSVRVTGKLVSFDPAADRAVIEHKNARLAISTELIDAFPFEQGVMTQFIGELHRGQDHMPLLQARVVRNVDTLDMDLYEKVIVAIRSNLARR